MDLEKEIAALKKELSVAKKQLEQKTDELEAFKKSAKAEIEAIKAENIVIVKGNVVEHEGKKYEFKIARFAVLGFKGSFKAEDIAKNPDQDENRKIIAKLVDSKSSIIAEIIAE